MNECFLPHSPLSSALQTGEDSEEVVRLCCVIKPMVTWNSERVATICRERCGGQGYLSVNRFGSFVGAFETLPDSHFISWRHLSCG